jgi:hypothetical protein
VIEGFFSPTHLGHDEPAFTDVPLLDAFLYLPLLDAHISLQFLVDTGADMTVIHPRDSLRLVSRSDWPRVRELPSESLTGAGQGIPYYFAPVVLIFSHVDGGIEQLTLPVGIAEPEDRLASHESLLGRDVLARFTMTFSQPERLVLELKGSSPNAL